MSECSSWWCGGWYFDDISSLEGVLFKTNRKCVVPITLLTQLNSDNYFHIIYLLFTIKGLFFIISIIQGSSPLHNMYRWYPKSKYLPFYVCEVLCISCQVSHNNVCIREIRQSEIAVCFGRDLYHQMIRR